MPPPRMPPPPSTWYCGHCLMMNGFLDMYCCACNRRLDESAVFDVPETSERVDPQESQSLEVAAVPNHCGGNAEDFQSQDETLYFGGNGPISRPHLAWNRQRRSSDISDISQASSLASIADSIFSFASASSMSSMMSTYGAGDRLIALLREDPVLRPLYQEGFAKISAEKLERNLRRLLKRFAVDLRKEAENLQQRCAAHFVRSRATNSAHIICSSLGGNETKMTPKLFLHVPREAEAKELEDVSDNSSDSDNQDDELADLCKLEEFLVTSRAFETLRQNLRLFVYPEDSAAAVPKLGVNIATDECQSFEPAIAVAEPRQDTESCALESKIRSSRKRGALLGSTLIFLMLTGLYLCISYAAHLAPSPLAYIDYDRLWIQPDTLAMLPHVAPSMILGLASYWSGLLVFFGTASSWRLAEGYHYPESEDINILIR
jgi:hypothetical protein